MEIYGYTDTGSIRAVIDGVAVTVPDDPANRHRQLIAEWEAEGNTIPAYQAPPPTAAAVNAERDRRIVAGLVFNGVLYQTRDQDRENIAGAGALAIAAIMNGAQAGDFRWHGGDTDFAWIAADNSLQVMDAPTLIAFGNAVANRKAALIHAARVIKDMDPIPADFAEDSYWPS